jgi:hypothetical protein
MAIVPADEQMGDCEFHCDSGQKVGTNSEKQKLKKSDM